MAAAPKSRRCSSARRRYLGSHGVSASFPGTPRVSSSRLVGAHAWLTHRRDRGGCRRRRWRVSREHRSALSRFAADGCGRPGPPRAIVWKPGNGGGSSCCVDAARARTYGSTLSTPKAVLSETAQDDAIAYLGDDVTDEDAFRAVKTRGVGVLVRPEFRETEADVWLKPPQELVEFMRHWSVNKH